MVKLALLKGFQYVLCKDREPKNTTDRAINEQTILKLELQKLELREKEILRQLDSQLEKFDLLLRNHFGL